MKKRDVGLFITTLFLILSIKTQMGISEGTPNYIQETIDPIINPIDVTPTTGTPYRVEGGTKFAYMLGKIGSDVVIWRSSDGINWDLTHNFGYYEIMTHGTATAGLFVSKGDTIVVSLWDNFGEYLMRSDDYGISFSTVHDSTDSVFVDTIETPSGEYFLMSYGGLTLGGPVILHSTDDGKTWSEFYRYPIPVQHCEAIAYHEKSNRLYASFGHNPEYTYGYCELDTGEWTWLYTDVLDDWMPQMAPNSMTVQGDYIISATEPQKTFSTVSNLQGKSFFMAYSTYLQYGVGATTHRDVAFIGTTVEGSYPIRNVGVFAVIPESGLWIEILKTEDSVVGSAIAHISRSAYKNWLYATFFNDDGKLVVFRFYSPTRDELYRIFQKKYVGYSISRTNDTVTEDFLSFAPMTWVKLNQTIENATVNFHRQAAPVVGVWGFNEFNDTDRVSGSAKYSIVDGNGVYGKKALNITGGLGDYVTVNLAPQNLYANFDSSNVLVIQTKSPDSTTPILEIELYQGGLLRSKKLLTKGTTLGLGDWLWYCDYSGYLSFNTTFKIKILEENVNFLLDAACIVQSGGKGIMGGWSVGFGRDWQTLRGVFNRPCNSTKIPPYVCINGTKYVTSEQVKIRGPLNTLNVTVPPYGSSLIKLSINGTIITTIPTDPPPPPPPPTNMTLADWERYWGWLKLQGNNHWSEFLDRNLDDWKTQEGLD